MAEKKQPFTARGKKLQQIDLAGEEVEVAEGWTIDSAETKELHRRTFVIASKIPQLRERILPDEVQCVRAHKDKRTPPGKKNENWHIFAQITKARPVFLAIAEAQGVTLKPFVIEFFPAFFKEPEQRQAQIMIHELYHVKVNENTGKKSLRPHWGFGDTDVEELYQRYLAK